MSKWPKEGDGGPADRPSRFFLSFCALGLILASVSCKTTTEELDGQDLKLDMEWDELMAPPDFEPKESAETKSMPDWLTTWGWDVPESPGPTLAPRLSRHSAEAAAQISRSLTATVPYEGGIYGVSGRTKVYVAPTAKIKDYSRLYWVMVKVLSEKYGCFMVAKQYHRDTTRVWCRDKRQIVFWQSRGPRWIQFASRQYDREGFEIVVKNRRVIRVSPYRII